MEKNNKVYTNLLTTFVSKHILLSSLNGLWYYISLNVSYYIIGFVKN